MLEKCLSGVLAMDIMPDEVFVVYRPSADIETVNWLHEFGVKKYPSVNFVEVGTPGQIAALNMGISKVESDIVVIYDDDAVPHKNWLSRVLVHYGDESIAGVGGRDVVHPLINQPALNDGVGARNFWGMLQGGHHLVEGTPRLVDVLKGCNLSFRMSVLNTLKFDERLSGEGAQVGNDAWFCLNVRHAGWGLCLDPLAIVDHYPAQKEDYERSDFTEYRCFESTHNMTALELAGLSMYKKALYILYTVVVGSRNCPGFYFFMHSLVKRPRKLVGQLKGGWKGFFQGYKLAKELEMNRPGGAIKASKVLK